ncbi:MAG: UDP-N-acetylglucosamine--N-acetylmuramyl-(pentapeptide) pyrophosphoryl-undecaprenol N-acetylglucosamine transferase [Planctomycetales bacterium]
MSHIVFAGGVSGSHLFPGLAVAEQLSLDRPDVRTTFCGTGTAFQRNQVFQAGFQYQGIPCPSRPDSLRSLWRFYKKKSQGSRLAAEFIQAENISVVVGLGDIPSLPMARAAIRAGINLVLLEQNSLPSRATRTLAPFASHVCLSFPGTQHALRTASTSTVTGTPVRNDFQQRLNLLDQHRQRQLVILGGHDGDCLINHWMPRALHRLRKLMGDWNVVHQSGPDLESTRLLYREMSLSAEVTPLIKDLPELLGESDLVVCRPGGTTLAELAQSGVPAVLFPGSQADGDQQQANARYFQRAGAAISIDSTRLSDRTDEELSEYLLPLVCDETRCQKMAGRMSHLAFPNATRDVANIISSMLPAVATRPRAQAA